MAKKQEVSGKPMRVMRRRVIFALLSFSLILAPVSAYAAPGTLANRPLFLGATVQPNILLLVDMTVLYLKRMF